MKNQKVKTNENLLNVLTPSGIEISKDEIKIGDIKGRGCYINKYSNSLPLGYFHRMNNIAGTIFVSAFIPKDEATIISAINRDITNNRSIAISSKQADIRNKAERRADDGEIMLQQMDISSESVGSAINVAMGFGNSDEDLHRTYKKINSTMAVTGCQVRPLGFMQESAYKVISPYNKIPKEIEEIAGRAMPLSTFMGSIFPSTEGFNDGAGYYLGKDSNGGIMVADLWKRGNDRTNSNIVVLGSSGQGKSTLVKKLIVNEFMKGTKLILIDPEAEYGEITKELGGDIINMGGNKKGDGILNPLDIKNIVVNEELEDEETDEMGGLATHLQALEVFFSLYLEEATTIKKELLNENLIELYKNFGIDFDTKIDKDTELKIPIMEDLCLLLEKKYENAKQEKINVEEYKDLVLLIKGMARGSSQFFFNGQTNIKREQDIVCLVTQNLNNVSSRVKKAQYFNIMNWCWDEIRKNRNERIMLICDEAYLLIDPEIPQTLVGLKNTMKRARKYEGSLCIVSQSIADFLFPAIKQQGQALLNIPTYKFFLGCDGQDLDEVSEVFKLKERQREILQSQQRGKGLAIIGKDTFSVYFELAEYEKAYCIGGRGGR